jgi:hypothetical protein
VTITAPELSRSSAALTDDEGTFEFQGLPAGRYTVSVSRAGFVTLSWGQRRPMQPGTPIQLAEGQTLSGIDFRMLRGSVISGRVYDQTGEPMAGIMVRVMRLQFVQGQRQLVPAGSGQTDDRGQYRVWGLNPGDYYVSAAAPMLDREGPERGDQPGSTVNVTAGRSVFTNGRGSPGSLSYAPTFFPGVVSALEARPVNVGLSAEAAGIDFNLLRVQTSTVSGRVIGIDGGPARGAAVTLSGEGQSLRAGGPFGGVYNGRVQGDGSFSISGVPPGRYLLRAFAGGGRGRGDEGNNGTASQTIAVNGDVSVHLALSPGALLTGLVTPEGSGTWPDMSQFRVSVISMDGPSPGGIPSARVASTGYFEVQGIPAGTHLIRVQGARGWVLHSALANGRDIVDTPLSIRSGEELNDVSLVVTDQLSEINGKVTDAFGTAVPEFTVLAFPMEASLWHPQSRHIMTARPDQTGRYQLRGLPAGEYYLAVIDPVEPGEWFDPAFLERERTGAVRVTVLPGNPQVQDFRIAGQ